MTKVASLSGVGGAAGGLTLSVAHITGTVPTQTSQGGGFGGGPPQGGGRFAGPRGINFSLITVSGVDQSKPDLGAITSGEITSGRYFSAGTSREAILNVSYARRKGIGLGDQFTVGSKKLTVVGLAETPIGGQSADVYVKLLQLQALSGRAGRVNTVYVRATSAGQVDAVARNIKASVSGSSVTTAQSLANSVTGSLKDAKSLTGKLGMAL